VKLARRGEESDRRFGVTRGREGRNGEKLKKEPSIWGILERKVFHEGNNVA
jgi:hypothetical protein